MTYREYQFVSDKMVVWVKIASSGKIVGAAPIIRKFIGQSYVNLYHWMSKQKLHGVYQLELRRSDDAH